MRLFDISSPIDPGFWEPEEVSVSTLSARDGARHLADEMAAHFGMQISPEDLPDGEFLTNDTVTATTHTGTHIDAPAHYGSRGRNGAPRTIDQLPLEWFHGPGLLLDVTGAEPGTISADRLKSAFDQVGRAPAPGDIVLLRTGADVHTGTQRYFTDFVGLDRPATELLLDLGVRVIGTDAFSLDAPFTHILGAYAETKNPDVLWPAHMLGRSREYCQIERLANLGSLPRDDDFTVICFPVKIAGAGAGWTRAVAVFDEATQSDGIAQNE